MLAFFNQISGCKITVFTLSLKEVPLDQAVDLVAGHKQKRLDSHLI